MHEPTLSDVRDALERGERETALAMVDRVLTAAPTAEGWMLAAQIVESAEDKVKLLHKALELDPAHVGARQQAAALGMELPPAGSAPRPVLGFPDADEVAPMSVGGVRREGNQTVHVEGVYEMLWDCRFCGTKKLLGKSQKFCAVCGAQQDPDWRYYPSDAEKVAVKDHRFVGADKICPNCSSLNVADADFCTRCGAPQNAAASVKAQAARSAQGASGVAGFMTEDLDARQMAQKYGQFAPAAAAASTRPKWLLPVIGVVVLGVIAFALFAIFAKREESGYVTAFDWERTIEIDRLAAVRGSQECPAPADAYNVSRRYTQVGSRQVPDGQECYSRQVDQGDGSFRQERVCETRYRSEPVMGYMCDYTVNRWGHSRTAKNAGDKDDTPDWPVTNARGCATLGCEREGRRSEAYRITITAGEDKVYTCELPFTEWQSTPLEATYRFNVRIVGGGIDCSSLERTG